MNQFFSSFAFRYSISFVLVVVVFCVLGIHDVEAQCAMCRASVETNYNNGAGEASTRLNTGILYLLSMPYLLIGTIAFLWYRRYKKSNGKKTFNFGGYSAS